MAATEEPTMIQAASGHAPSEHVDTHDADDTEKEKDIKPEVADRESERAPTVSYTHLTLPMKRIV